MNAFILFFSAALSGAMAAQLYEKFPDGGFRIETTADNQFLAETPAFVSKSAILYSQQPAFLPIATETFPSAAFKIEYPSEQFPALIAAPAAKAAYPFIPSQQTGFVPIVAQSHIHQPSGAFQLAYKSADGASFSEQGSLKRNFENNGDVLVKSGQYSYVAPDGTPVSVAYVADEYGFRASGSHIPTPQ